ncbi:hypothetical protein PRZ48_008114 [Zasmidium cellare]|uniref:6-methylsalicylate decarboxylase n=1 Tax=Zasmidium cellare TaxID=395010 RepID=A0ABR0EFT9_ZASCE|nr:hypothetical protein PRZ48_008114 [Zasmidium cellare]
MSRPLIDTHHHWVKDFYTKAIEENGGDPSGWTAPEWNLEDDRAFNAKYNIKVAVLSLTAPGACIVKGREGRSKLARQANEHCAKIRDAEPDKYGFFASLPSLLDKQDALDELAYALDTLKADGVTLFTRYGQDNHYLGHPDFKEIWDELDRREVVVFIHPTHPVDTHLVNPGMLQPMLVYPFETTQTAVDMMLNGVIQSHRKVKVILSHAGGMLPWIVTRPASIWPNDSEEQKKFLDGFKRFYYDTAISLSPSVLNTLEGFVKSGHLEADHILFGSDYPYASRTIISHHTPLLESHDFELKEMRDGIAYKNALKLFPRLAQYVKAE